jgi:glycosyltransferase involved in cell wall biosynthesis
MSAVLNTYKEICEQFNYITSNVTMSKSKLKKILVLIKAFYVYIRYCFSDSIKIIHINTASYTDFFRNSLFVSVGKIFKKKILLQIHGGMFEQFYNSHSAYTRKIINKCDCIIAVSDFLGKFIKTLTNREVIVLPNMIERPLFEKKIFNTEDNNRLSIVFLGAINENKGIFDILNVFENNCLYFKDKVELHICGVGDIRRLEDSISRARLNDFVIYHGWLNKFEKHRLLSQSDILIQPSYFESFGISIVEGMSYGLSIIATNVGGIPELVEDKVNGILISPGNKSQLINAIKWFIENPSCLNKMGEESVRKTEPFYREYGVAKLNAIYTEILLNRKEDLRHEY